MTPWPRTSYRKCAPRGRESRQHDPGSPSSIKINDNKFKRKDKGSTWPKVVIEYSVETRRKGTSNPTPTTTKDALYLPHPDLLENYHRRKEEEVDVTQTWHDTEFLCQKQQQSRCLIPNNGILFTPFIETLSKRTRTTRRGEGSWYSLRENPEGDSEDTRVPPQRPLLRTVEVLEVSG